MGEDPQRLRDVLAGERLLLTPEEAAELLPVGRTTIYALMKAGVLQPVHIGRSCQISRAELERFVRSLEAPVPNLLVRRYADERARTRADCSSSAPALWMRNGLCIPGPRASHRAPTLDAVDEQRRRSSDDGLR